MVVFGTKIETQSKVTRSKIDKFVDETDKRLLGYTGLALYLGKARKVGEDCYLVVMKPVVPQIVGIYVSMALIFGGLFMAYLFGISFGTWLIIAGVILYFVWNFLFSKEFYFEVFKKGVRKATGKKLKVEDVTEDVVLEVLG